MTRRKRSYRRRSKRGRYRRKDNRIPLLPALGLVTAFTTPTSTGKSVIGNLKTFTETMDPQYIQWAGSALLQKFSGIDLTTSPGQVQWRPMEMVSGIGAIIAGSIGSKIATRFGANRMMKKIPLAGRYIKL